MEKRRLGWLYDSLPGKVVVGDLPHAARDFGKIIYIRTPMHEWRAFPGIKHRPAIMLLRGGVEGFDFEWAVVTFNSTDPRYVPDKLDTSYNLTSLLTGLEGKENFNEASGRLEKISYVDARRLFMLPLVPYFLGRDLCDLRIRGSLSRRAMGKFDDFLSSKWGHGLVELNTEAFQREMFYQSVVCDKRPGLRMLWSPSKGGWSRKMKDGTFEANPPSLRWV